MAQFRLDTLIEAPQEKVWSTLADYGGIARWNTAITDSYITTGPEKGAGATRRCDLPNGKHVEERIERWEEGQVLGIAFLHMPAPVRDVYATFRLEKVAQDRTRIDLEYRFTAKGLWKLDTPLFGMFFKSKLKGLLRDLKRSVEHEVNAQARRPGLRVTA